MKIMVLGCGMQGRASAFDLARNSAVKTIVLADNNSERLDEVSKWLNCNKAKSLSVDANNPGELKKQFAGFDAILSCAPYEHCLAITEAAIAAEVSLVDLGGDTEVVKKQLALSNKAKEKNITIIPDCGVSPGITNAMVGHGMEQLDFADEVWVRDGGLPQRSEPPLYYAKLFSIDVLINEYMGKTTAVREGKIVEVDGLSEVETVDFPAPIGKCEAAHGMGMLSTLPWTYEGRIMNMDNKFVRYPGHISFFQTLKTLGFFSSEKAKGCEVAPRQMTKYLLEKHLDRPGIKDLYVLQVRMKGKKGSKYFEINYNMLDHSDEASGLLSMARTTGFTASIVAQMLAAGAIKERGVLPPELALPKEIFFSELKKRGFKLEWSIKECR